MSYKRTRLSDRNFENLVFVKANQWLADGSVTWQIDSAALNYFLFYIKIFVMLVSERRELLKLFPQTDEIKF